MHQVPDAMKISLLVNEGRHSSGVPACQRPLPRGPVQLSSVSVDNPAQKQGCTEGPLMHSSKNSRP
jgi:hypothetical protein